MDIRRQIRRRSDRRFVAPVTVMTMLDVTEAFAAIRSVCERHNAVRVAEHERAGTEGSMFARLLAAGTDVQRLQFHPADGGERELLIGYERTPESILATVSQAPGYVDGYWLARARMLEPPAPRVVERRLELSLTSWVTDAEGRVANTEKYTELTEMIVAALAPAGGRSALVYD